MNATPSDTFTFANDTLDNETFDDDPFDGVGIVGARTERARTARLGADSFTTDSLRTDGLRTSGPFRAAARPVAVPAVAVARRPVTPVRTTAAVRALGSVGEPGVCGTAGGRTASRGASTGGTMRPGGHGPARRTGARRAVVATRRLAAPANGPHAPAPVRAAGRPGAPAAGRVGTSRRAASETNGRTHLTVRGRVLLVLALVAVLFGAFSAGRSATQAAGNPTGATAAAADFQQITVQAGDTLWSVASALAPQNDPRDVVAQIRRINHLPDAQIQIGQQLLLPTAR